jgi:hypothetical protein
MVKGYFFLKEGNGLNSLSTRNITHIFSYLSFKLVFFLIKCYQLLYLGMLFLQRGAEVFPFQQHFSADRPKNLEKSVGNTAVRGLWAVALPSLGLQAVSPPSKSDKQLLRPPPPPRPLTSS